MAAAASLADWLGAGIFKALGPYLEDELGVDCAPAVRQKSS